MLNPITDLSALAEQLCRIEHKLDLLITHLATKDGTFVLSLMKDGGIDPLTLENVTYYMDIMKRHVVRRTSDGSGLSPPSSVLFSSPETDSTTGNNNGGNEGSNSSAG